MYFKINNKNRSINKLLKHIKIQDLTIKKMIRKSCKNLYNNKIKETHYYLGTNKNLDVRQQDVVKRYKLKTNFNTKSKKLTVKRNNKKKNLMLSKSNKSKNNKSNPTLSF